MVYIKIHFFPSVFFFCYSLVQVEDRAKKKSLVSGNRPDEKKNYHSPARKDECVSEYTFLSSKSNKQTKKQQ